MRHRISFFHAATDQNPFRHVSNSHVSLNPALHYDREDKYTINTGPLSHITALRIQINKSTHGSNTTSPLAYDNQYGVHIYVVPKGSSNPGESGSPYAHINAILQEILGITVEPEKWVVSLNSFYYHTSDAIVPHIKEIDNFPNSWDAFDYYYAQNKLVVRSLEQNSQRLAIDASNSTSYTEVGIFHATGHSTRDDLVLSGARVILNDDEVEDDAEYPAQKTLFHVKPRHRPLAQKSSVMFKQNGLHPVITLNNLPPTPVDDDVLHCKLFCYLTLAKSVFLDPYQIPEQLKIVANYGDKDLELPSYLVSSWGNEILMEFDEPPAFPIDLTLHSRYQLPSENSSYTEVPVDLPVIFYACDVTSDSHLLHNSPFDNKQYIGGTFEKFFTDDTVFYHASDRGSVQVQIPNAVGNGTEVALLTFISVLVGTLTILFKLYRRLMSSHPSGSNRAKKEE